MSTPNSDYYFLKGGGEMGALIRAKDWSTTSLGDPADWPQSLRTMVSVMLENPFAMYITWGNDYTQIYNDGFRPILGANKHPHALGNSTRETFSEIWDIIGPMFDNVMKGNAIAFSDLMLPLNRNGFTEECYFNFSYSPIRKDNGEVGGALVTVVETTNKMKAEEALKESETRFRAIADEAPVFIFLAGENAEVEYLNKTWRDYTGILSNDYKGRAWTEITHIDDIDSATKIYMDGFNQRESCTFENRQKGIDGIYRNILWKATPRFSLNGEFIGMMGVGLDIHERKKSEEKLKESEQKVRALVENAPFPIAVYVGKEMIVELANQSIIDIWGKGNDVIGKSFKEILPELDNQLVFEQIQKVFETGESFHTKNTPLDLMIEGKPYTYYFNYSFTPLYDTSGNIYGVMNTGVDLTELNLAKKKIEENEERLKIVLEASELGTYELNLKTKVPSYSKRYLEILGGYQEDIELTHEELLKHVHPDDFAIREKAFKAALKTGHLHYQARLIWKDNSIHWMEGKGKMFYDEEQKPIKLMGTIRDITEQKNHEEELKKSEEQFSTLADNMGNLAWLADGEGSIYWYNKRWLEYTGLSLEEMQGWGWQKVHHPDHVERIVDLSKKLWQTNETFELTFPLRRHDGEYRWFLTRGYPVTNEEGEITRWIGTNTDITEQKKAEEQFKILADQAPMWVWLTDKHVNIIYTNPEILKFFNIANYREFTGNLWEQRVHPDDIGMVYNSFEKAAALQQSFSFEFRVLNASSNLFEWYFIKAVPRIEGGECTGFIGTGININDQKTFAKELEEKVIQRTEELKASEEKFYNLFNLSPICKTLSDTSSGKIVMVNDSFTRLFGHSREETLGKTSAEMGLLDLEEREIMIAELKAKGKIDNREICFIKKSGEKFIALVSAEVILMGDKPFFLTAFNDISEIKKAEQNIKQKNTELEKMNKELQSFAYISSHDLQEPLRKIQTFTSRIKEKEEVNLSASAKDMFNRMQDAAKRMQTLIQDLLAYSRTNTAERTVENTDLNDIIAQVKEDLKEELAEKHAVIEARQLTTADIIPFQFRQLLHNLIGNSLKFSIPEKAPHIIIKSEIAKGIQLNNDKLSPQSKYCHISISDNGIGFEQQYSEKIFEVFQRLHGKNEYIGTGIGLSIVKKIVENHQGIITASGELNKGASFDIYIPAT